MPILTLKNRSWSYIDVGIVKRKFILHVERDPARTTQPRIRQYTTTYGYYNMRGFEGRVHWNRATASEGVWEYELLQDRNEGYFEITTHTPFASTSYISVKRSGTKYEVLEYLNADACIRAFHGNGRFGDVTRVISETPEGFEERREVGKPGPRDRYERILDFGIKGADPEPALEEVLDKVVVATPRVRKEVPEDDLLAALEKVEAPPKRGHVKNDELEALLDLIK